MRVRQSTSVRASRCCWRLGRSGNCAASMCNSVHVARPTSALAVAAACAAADMDAAPAASGEVAVAMEEAAKGAGAGARAGAVGMEALTLARGLAAIVAGVRPPPRTAAVLALEAVTPVDGRRHAA